MKVPANDDELPSPEILGPLLAFLLSAAVIALVAGSSRADQHVGQAA
ncbi:hypothetical protein Rhow_000728 [Rhodococcus wratislaviensis]|uniref:Uncharacterized protein n=1 Tax=Rhodococcus wratislaviensis TaxID=44752 RepID=A0A402C2I3_RHOWR|nr:hypothetical protein [Rhodococcus wratislaviensis]GCE37844.1 hypothetical protein Rhow_000728 [Rhodococcus wratislaviensis]